jgi:CheY-like chemotaxis protein
MKKVLIVDDEPFVRQALKRVLEHDSAVVEVADSAQSALDRVAAVPFDLVIVDIIMPGMDGVQLIRALRAQWSDLRIIAISGGGNFAVGGYRPDAISTQAYLAAATQAGADAVLAKPFEISELEAVVGPMFNAPATSTRH